MPSLHDLFYIALSLVFVGIIGYVKLTFRTSEKTASASNSSTLPTAIKEAVALVKPLAVGDTVQRVSKSGKVRGEGPVLAVINGGKTVVFGSVTKPRRVYKRHPDRLRRVATA